MLLYATVVQPSSRCANIHAGWPFHHRLQDKRLHIYEASFSEHFVRTYIITCFYAQELTDTPRTVLFPTKCDKPKLCQWTTNTRQLNRPNHQRPYRYAMLIQGFLLQQHFFNSIRNTFGTCSRNTSTSIFREFSQQALYTLLHSTIVRRKQLSPILYFIEYSTHCSHPGVSHTAGQRAIEW